jgi:hypothetical protein
MIKARMHALALLALLPLLLACGDDEPDLLGGGDPSTRVPPPIPPVSTPTQVTLPDVPGAVLETRSGARAQAGVGSFCWAAICIDYAGPVTNANPVVLTANDSFTITFEAGTPSATGSVWLPAPSPRPGLGPEGVTWSGLSPTLTRDESGPPVPPPAPGLYVLVVQAFWEDRGDITYGFYVERR